MAGDITLTVIGNLTSDPELRYTNNGVAVASFTVASTPRVYDRNSGGFRDGDPIFMRCSAWRELGENVAESCSKGMRVIVSGRLQQRSYETQQGEKRQVMEMQVDEIGPSLRFATAQVTRMRRDEQGGSFGGGYAGGNAGGYQNNQGGDFGGGYNQPPAQNYGQPGPMSGNAGTEPAGNSGFDDGYPF